MIKIENNLIKLDTKNTSYILKIVNGIIEHIYYGAKIKNCEGVDKLALQHKRNLAVINKNYEVDLSTRLLECTFFDVGDFSAPDFKILDENNVAPQDFLCSGYEIINGRYECKGLPYGRAADGVQTLVIEYYSKSFGVKIKTCYSVYESIDVIARYAIVYTEKNGVKIEKATSASLSFSDEKFKVLTLGGVYGRERVRHIHEVPFGTSRVSSSQGCSSHSATPGVILTDINTDENKGRAFGLQLVYSGNFSMDTQLDDYGKMRVQIGVDYEHFEYSLVEGTEFYTPEALLTYSDNGYNGVSIAFVDYIREYLMPERFAKSPRPIVVNTWEAFYFNINEEKLLAFAEIAKKVGVDTVVVDDGWFSSRRNDTSGLGDWTVSKDVFPSGLKAFSKKLKAIGLNWGIWIEPEMVNPKSELFQLHPDWVLGGKDDTLSRNQLVLDFTNPDVVDYIYTSLVNAFEGMDLHYIKWDFNRYISPYLSNYTKNGKEIAYRYMLGVYDLLNRLTQHFGSTMFETCAGGGGRFDAGMLAYSPQIWTSDNTDAFERAYIQSGASYFYPSSSISCHVATNNGGTKLSPSLDFVFGVALNGVLGYEFNLFKLSEDSILEINKQIEFYRSVQDLMLKGDFYRLITPFDDYCYYAYAFVSKDKKQAFVSFNVLHNFANSKDVYLKIFGLDDDAVYQIDDFAFSGKILKEKGIPMPIPQKSGQSFRFLLNAI